MPHTNSTFDNWVVDVVKLSACFPSNPMIRVRVPLKSTVFRLYICFEKFKNKQMPGEVTIEQRFTLYVEG